MIHLIWSILNLTLWFYFLHLLAGLVFRGRRVFQGRLRSFSIVLVVVGIGHIITADDDDTTIQSITLVEGYEPQNDSKSYTVELERMTWESIRSVAR